MRWRIVTSYSYGYVMISLAVSGTDILPFSVGTSHDSLILDFAMIPFDMSHCYDPFCFDPCDMIRWYDSFDMILWFDIRLLFVCYDMIQFSLICSVGYDMMLDMIWFVLFLYSSFYSTHGGTMGVSLKHQSHDHTFCGGVIDPRRPHLIWYVMSTLGHYMCVYLSYEQLYIYDLFVGGGVWMHSRYVGFCVGWMWVCAYTSSRWS